jgi:hypothetical protein
LSGHETDEEMAAAIDPGIDRLYTYAKDYLPNPGLSLFALERRHANIALSNKGHPLRSRLHRTTEFWLDPTFLPPPDFIEELRAAVPASTSRN